MVQYLLLKFNAQNPGKVDGRSDSQGCPRPLRGPDPAQATPIIIKTKQKPPSRFSLNMMDVSYEQCARICKKESFGQEKFQMKPNSYHII